MIFQEHVSNILFNGFGLILRVSPELRHQFYTVYCKNQGARESSAGKYGYIFIIIRMYKVPTNIFTKGLNGFS